MYWIGCRLTVSIAEASPMNTTKHTSTVLNNRPHLRRLNRRPFCHARDKKFATGFNKVFDKVADRGLILIADKYEVSFRLFAAHNLSPLSETWFSAGFQQDTSNGIWALRSTSVRQNEPVTRPRSLYKRHRNAKRGL